ncbi:MAG: hypothetical protein RQ866_00950, partial [Bacteroidales bacterium]|nr:hypothetical protein [Bacteroidales bacterium]
GPGATKVGNSNEVTFRGARVGDALYLVDDVPQRSMSTNIPNRAIGNIKTIYGGVPSRYGDFMGGVIVVETRSYFEWLNEQHINELRIADSMKKEE